MDVMPEHNILQDGTQFWILDSNLHRTDGPDVIWSNGHQEWWLNGNAMTDPIKTWMDTKGVTWPWDAETQTEFARTWL